MSSVEIKVVPLRKMLQRFNESLGEHINEDQRYKLGRVLTIIDATIADQEQRKAIKDLVQNAWWLSDSYANRAVSNNAMTNPHTDLRAICKVLGFELYEPNAGNLPTEGNNEDFVVKRYQKIANED